MRNNILKIVASIYCLVVMNGTVLVANAWSAIDNLTLRNQVISVGQTVNLSVRKNITVGPAYEIASGANVTLRAGTQISLVPGYQAAAGSEVFMAIGWDDVTPPRIISNYPHSGKLSTHGQPLNIRYVFDDNGGSGIYSVKFYDVVDPANNIVNEITSQSSVTDSTLLFEVVEPVDGRVYHFRIRLEDVAGNIHEEDLVITVDNSSLYSWADLSGGDYTDQVPFQVTLISSKVATIFYSTDGYPPFVGAANTINAEAPVSVQINRTTPLMFFAMDQAGNRESTNREVYVVLPESKPTQVSNLNASYQAAQELVALSWSNSAGAQGYHVYRCGNAIECAVLADSGKGGYPPPSAFLLSNTTGIAYNDSSITAGGVYSYAVAAHNQAGVEGALSPLVQVDISTATPAVDQVEAERRASAWLGSQQSLQGSWGDRDGLRMLATSQVLNALRLNSSDSAALRQGVFYLRGHQADNNDYLARQIATLRDYGQDTAELTTILISEGYFDTGRLYGWGVESRYYLDALTTALAAKALEGSAEGVLLDNDQGYREALTGLGQLPYPVESNTSGRFSWAAENVASVYVSSLVYHIINSHYSNEPSPFDQNWIVGAQNADGSFGTGLIDTAAVLLWLSPGSGDRLEAINYLVSRQETNGSWNNDPYLTGLCLEALLSNQ